MNSNQVRAAMRKARLLEDMERAYVEKHLARIENQPAPLSVLGALACLLGILAALLFGVLTYGDVPLSRTLTYVACVYVFCIGFFWIGSRVSDRIDREKDEWLVAFAKEKKILSSTEPFTD